MAAVVCLGSALVLASCAFPDRLLADHFECSAGQCSCENGFADCDDDETNGCESDLHVDPQHCGACGNHCQGAACSDARCEPLVLVTDPDGVRDLAVGATHVYWTNGYEVQAVPRQGGEPWILAEGQTYLWDIAVHDGFVYWRCYANKLWRAPELGGDAEELAAGSANPNNFVLSRRLATLTGAAYWRFGDSTRDGVERCPYQDGDCVEHWAGSVGSVMSLATFGDELGWIGTQGIYLSPPQGEAALLTSDAYGLDIVMDETSVYWAGIYPRSLFKASRADPTPIVLADPTPDDAMGVAVDELGVYWTTRGGYIYRTSLDGAETVELADDQSSPEKIRVDQGALFWQSGNSLMTLAR